MITHLEPDILALGVRADGRPQAHWAVPAEPKSLCFSVLVQTLTPLAHFTPGEGGEERTLSQFILPLPTPTLRTGRGPRAQGGEMPGGKEGIRPGGPHASLTLLPPGEPHRDLEGVHRDLVLHGVQRGPAGARRGVADREGLGGPAEGHLGRGNGRLVGVLVVAVDAEGGGYRQPSEDHPWRRAWRVPLATSWYCWLRTDGHQCDS